MLQKSSVLISNVIQINDGAFNGGKAADGDRWEGDFPDRLHVGVVHNDERVVDPGVPYI